ncbi:MAG: 50S ribosomal protein L24 [bacterium]
MAKLHVKRDDRVIVLSGKEKGKSGRVLRVFPKEQRVLVEKLNMVKRHSRPRSQTDQGGIIEKEAPIHISNTMVICPRCGEPTRVGRRILEGVGSVRVCKKCEEIIDKT